MLISKIGQIAVIVKDTARAVAFYRDTLELPLLFEAPPSLAFFDCGGVRLMLTPPEGDPGTSVLYFPVADIEAAAATLKSRGVAFDRDPHLIAKRPAYDLWMAFFRDSEGNLLALMCEKSRA